MSMRHTLQAILLATIMAGVGMSAQAYQYTGAIKTLESGAWKHWQEIKLQKDDDSVWTPCRRFTRQLRTLTAKPVTFTTEDCVNLSEELSGVTKDQHDNLPIGASLWVPYVPVDVTVTSADVSVLQFDPMVLEEALATVQATMLSEDEIVLLISNSTSTLERALMQQIQQLRTELSSEQSSNNQMLLARLTALEAAAENGQPIPGTNTVATGSIAEGLAALTDQVNDLAGLRTDLTDLQSRLNTVETDLNQVKDDLSNKADTTTVDVLSNRVTGLEGQPKVEVSQFNSLSDRVQTLEDRPTAGNAALVNQTGWFWWLVALTVAAVMLFGLVAWLFRRTSKTNDMVKDHGRRIKDVEELVSYVLTYNAQQRFVSAELTDDRLNELSVGESIKLIIKEQGIGAAHPHIHLKKGENSDGSEYLQLIGIEDSAGERLSPKRLKGCNADRFTVIQVFRKIADAIKDDRIIGVGKDPAHQQ